MRFLKLNILVAALVLFTAAGASAWQVRDTSAQYGTSINIGDSVTVTIDLNTDGGTDLFALGVGFLFEGTGFTYDQGSSATNTYLLYTTAKNPYLIPASTCGGVSGSGCDTYLTVANQVQLDFVSSAVGTAQGVPAASVGYENLVTLVFQAAQDGTGVFQFSFEKVTGGVLGLADGTQPNLKLGENITVTVPEPALALMSMAALGTVVLIRRNRR